MKKSSLTSLLVFAFVISLTCDIYNCEPVKKGKKGGSPLILMDGGDDHGHGDGGDIILFGGGKGCSPGLIKDGGHHDKGDVMLLPGCKKKKKPKHVEYVPLPYPVKEYVPIPMKHEEMSHEMPPDMPHDMPMEHMDMPLEMPIEHMPMDQGFGLHGLDSRRRVTRLRVNRHKPMSFY